MQMRSRDVVLIFIYLGVIAFARKDLIVRKLRGHQIHWR